MGVCVYWDLKTGVIDSLFEYFQGFLWFVLVYPLGMVFL